MCLLYYRCSIVGSIIIGTATVVGGIFGIEVMETQDKKGKPKKDNPEAENDNNKKEDNNPNDSKTTDSVIKDYKKFKSQQVGQSKIFKANNNYNIFLNYKTGKNYLIKDTASKIEAIEITNNIGKYIKINDNMGFIMGEVRVGNTAYPSSYGQLFLLDLRKPKGKQIYLLKNFHVTKTPKRINENVFYLKVKDIKLQIYRPYLFDAMAAETSYLSEVLNPWDKVLDDYYPLADNFGFFNFQNAVQFNTSSNDYFSGTFYFIKNKFKIVNKFTFNLYFDDIRTINENKLVVSLQKYWYLPSKILSENKDLPTRGNNLKFIFNINETDLEKQLESVTNEYLQFLKIEWIKHRPGTYIIVNENTILYEVRIFSPDHFELFLIDLLQPIGKRARLLNNNFWIKQYQIISNTKVELLNSKGEKWLLDLEKPLNQQFNLF